MVKPQHRGWRVGLQKPGDGGGEIIAANRFSTVGWIYQYVLKPEAALVTTETAPRFTWLLRELTAPLIRHSPTGRRFYGPWNKVGLWGHFLFMWNNRVGKHSERHGILMHGLDSCGLLLEVEWKWPRECSNLSTSIRLSPSWPGRVDLRGQRGVNHQNTSRKPQFRTDQPKQLVNLHPGLDLDHLRIHTLTRSRQFSRGYTWF